MLIGYTTGVYDLFHIGHLNLLKNAKAMCDKLVVGVTIDVCPDGGFWCPENYIALNRACKYPDNVTLAKHWLSQRRK